MRRPGAFTLIELLIVVAIIAILAAIAVPNFVESQVRAKVSRSRADMRSFAVGVEAYAVEWNEYPHSGFTNSEASVKIYGYNPLAVVTTPVAYLASLPEQSPFGTWIEGYNLAEPIDGYQYEGGKSFERKTSDGMSRTILVIGATVTSPRYSNTESRVRIRTGLLLSGRANLYQRISPCFIRHPKPVPFPKPKTHR